MRFFSPLSLALLVLVPIATATGFHPGKGGQDCKKNEFWWKDKDSCLPVGGPSMTPRPPNGIECPLTGYYWGEKQKCCVPKHNPPPTPPKPGCPKGWEWNPIFWTCKPVPHPPTPPKPQPSKSWQHPHHGGHRRSIPSRCPEGLTACPIAGLSSEDYECLDTFAELESCGGCASDGTGQDCTAIPGAWNVACEVGSCKVYTCAAGYRISKDGKACNPLQ